MKNFSEMFRRVKHAGYIPSERDIETIVSFLRDRNVLFAPEAHSAIYILCSFTKPDREKIRIVESFLSEEANDYSRSAALLGLITLWKLEDEFLYKYVTVILENILTYKAYDTANSAIYCAAFWGIKCDDKEMREILCVALGNLHDHAGSGDDDIDEYFIKICRSIVNFWLVKQGLPPKHISDLSEAYEVYRSRKMYV